jgi:TonB family protein
MHVVLLSCSAFAGEWFAKVIDAPTYPILANQARIEGVVQLKLVVDGNGVVLRADVVSGNQVLARAAQDNIRKWKFVAPCSAGPKTIDFTYEFKLEGEVEEHPRTIFRYEHPYKVIVESQAVHWMPAGKQ